jgi:hypothetical protein
LIFKSKSEDKTMPKIQNFNTEEIKSNAGRPSKYNFSEIPVNSRETENPSGAVFGTDEGEFKAVSAAARQYAHNAGIGATIRETEEGTLVVFWDQPQRKAPAKDSTASKIAPKGGKTGSESAS